MKVSSKAKSVLNQINSKTKHIITLYEMRRVVTS